MHIIPNIDTEFKNLIPPLSKDEYKQLEENILSARKCRDAIIVWDGIVIDGHNRLEICIQHGIEFKIEEMAFSSREEVMLWILDNQLSRRNLTDAMKIELALTKEEMLREKARKNQSQAGGDKTGNGALLSKSSTHLDEKLSVRKVHAANAGVSEGTLHNYMQIKNSANPELLERVKKGELKIGTAHRMLTKEIIKQLKRADKMYAFIAEGLPIKDNPEATQAIQDRLIELSKQLQTLQEKYTERKIT